MSNVWIWWQNALFHAMSDVKPDEANMHFGQDTHEFF